MTEQSQQAAHRQRASFQKEGEECQRCHAVGPDRRTLWMACFYAMEETGLPFDKKASGDREFYTLRVCKTCRADWMQFLGLWFQTPRDPRTNDQGLIELTEDEPAALNSKEHN